jgi:hypothetical protein
MEYEEYKNRVEQANRLFLAGKYAEAVDAFYQLFMGEVSDIDKAQLCASLAGVHDRMGQTEEALSWFDKGIAYEQQYCRYEIMEKKVQYLVTLGQSKDAIPILEGLIKQPYLTEAEKLRIRKSLQGVLGRSMAEWK